jgi:DNA-binding transcriptional ArsR family regulator
MIKKEHFDPELQELALLAKALSHPARLAILQYLAKTKTCISGNITDYIPLSRTTVSQHLKELKDLGLIQGEVDGLKVNYCLNPEVIKKYSSLLQTFLGNLDCNDFKCC